MRQSNNLQILTRILKLKGVTDLKFGKLSFAKSPFYRFLSLKDQGFLRLPDRKIDRLHYFHRFVSKIRLLSFFWEEASFSQTRKGAFPHTMGVIPILPKKSSLPLQKPLKRFSSDDTNKEKNLRLEKQKTSLLKTSLQGNNFLLFCYFSDFFSKYFLCFLKLIVDSLFYITSKVKRKFHVWLYSFFVNRSTFWSEPFPDCIF